jgi:hypothetical protein
MSTTPSSNSQTTLPLPAGFPPPSQGELVMKVIPMPSDVNANGDIFGGWVMAQVDLAGSVLPARHVKGRMATVAVNEFVFKQPVRVGDILSFYAKLQRIGRTSLQRAGPVHEGDRGQPDLCGHRRPRPAQAYTNKRAGTLIKHRIAARAQLPLHPAQPKLVFVGAPPSARYGVSSTAAALGAILHSKGLRRLIHHRIAARAQLPLPHAQTTLDFVGAPPSARYGLSSTAAALGAMRHSKGLRRLIHRRIAARAQLPLPLVQTKLVFVGVQD